MLAVVRSLSKSARVMEILQAAGGVMRRDDLLRHIGPGKLERAVHSGRIMHPYPRVYTLPTIVDEPLIAMRAALCFAGDDAVLSHTTALGLLGLSDLVKPVDPIHVDVGRGRNTSKREGLVVHRRLLVEAGATRSGLPVRGLDVSLVDSWRWLEDERLRRALVIEAVGRRMTTPARILEVATGGLRRLAQLLEAGCRSELELWGHDKVFREMPFRRNVAVDLGGRTVYLDLLDDATLTNVELDGREWHTSPAARERDQRRDAALAARGYLVVRVSGARLYREPDAVRAEVAAVIASRNAFSPGRRAQDRGTARVQR